MFFVSRFVLVLNDCTAFVALVGVDRFGKNASVGDITVAHLIGVHLTAFNQD